MRTAWHPGELGAALCDCSCEEGLYLFFKEFPFFSFAENVQDMESTSHVLGTLVLSFGADTKVGAGRGGTAAIC